MTENLPAVPAQQPAPALTLVQQGRSDLVDPTTDSWTAVVRDVATFAQQICDTEFVPKGMQGRPDKVSAAIMYGREIGLPPMNSLAAIHVINGKAGISAELMRSMVLQAGHEIEIVEMTSARVTVRGRRKGTQSWLTVSWTQEDAKQAGLLKNGTYAAYPRQMLTARATTELCRVLFPDVIHGLHSTEELESMDPELEAAAPAPAEPAKRTVKRTQGARKAAAEARKVEPATPEQPAPARQTMPLPAPKGEPADAGDVPIEGRPITEAVNLLWRRVCDAHPGIDQASRMAWISAEIGRDITRLRDLTEDDITVVGAALAALDTAVDAEIVDETTGEVEIR